MARGAAVGTRAVPPFLQHCQSSLSMARKGPGHCAALPAPLWQGFLLFFCQNLIEWKLFKVGMVSLLSVQCPVWAEDFRPYRCQLMPSLVFTRSLLHFGASWSTLLHHLLQTFWKHLTLQKIIHILKLFGEGHQSFICIISCEVQPLRFLK